jgi:hypothetical protein
MTRDEMIDWLVQNDFDYVNTTGGGLEWLRQILQHGFDGYADQPDHVLRQEILERDETAFDKETDNA